MHGFGRSLRKLPVNIALALRFKDAADDMRAVERLMELKPVFDGKCVAVVGNAQSIFAYPYGEEIDRHDTIIRMNHGFVRNTQHQGTRTDVLCVACQLDRHVVRKFQPKNIIFTGRKRDVMKFSMAISSEKIYFAPKTIYQDLSINFSHRAPSTGLVVIEMLRRYFAPIQITLFGFDWMQSKTFYRDIYYAAGHEWNKEKQIIEAWLNENPEARKLRYENVSEPTLSTPDKQA